MSHWSEPQQPIVSPVDAIAAIDRELKSISDEKKRRTLNKIESFFPAEGEFRRELYGKHLEFFRAGKYYRSRMFSAGNRCGKALSNAMPVLTPNGWKAIEKLQVGDEVIGGDGNPCYVTGVYPQGVMPVVELSFDDGASVVATLDHLWRCRQNKDRYKDKWTIRSTQEIIDKGGISGDRQKVAEIPVCCCYMRKGLIPVDPYIVGLLAGDGCYTGCTNQPALSTADAEIAESVARFYPIKKRDDGKYDYMIAGLVTDLKFLGMWGFKSHEKHIPTDYLWNSKHVRLALLQGLMDTDGTADKAGRAIFYSTSPQLIEAVVFLVRSLGGKAKVAPKQTYYFQKGVRTAGRPSWSVQISISVCPFRLKRKAERWSPLKVRTLERRLQSAEPKEPCECTCISVDSADSTFVTKDFIVTHNTVAGAYETALHLCGAYPDWWEGRRFDRAISAWACGVSNETTKNVVQAELLGRLEKDDGASEGMLGMGTGMIPSHLIAGVEFHAQIRGAIKTAWIKHVSGKRSVLGFKSYEQSSTAFEGASIDLVWMDESADLDIYTECLMRTMTVDGCVMITATPLNGLTDLVMQFMPDGVVPESQVAV